MQKMNWLASRTKAWLTSQTTAKQQQKRRRGKRGKDQNPRKERSDKGRKRLKRKNSQAKTKPVPSTKCLLPTTTSACTQASASVRTQASMRTQAVALDRTRSFYPPSNCPPIVRKHALKILVKFKNSIQFTTRTFKNSETKQQVTKRVTIGSWPWEDPFRIDIKRGIMKFQTPNINGEDFHSITIFICIPSAFPAFRDVYNNDAPKCPFCKANLRRNGFHQTLTKVIMADRYGFAISYNYVCPQKHTGGEKQTFTSIELLEYAPKIVTSIAPFAYYNGTLVMKTEVDNIRYHFRNSFGPTKMHKLYNNSYLERYYRDLEELARCYKLKKQRYIKTSGMFVPSFPTAATVREQFLNAMPPPSSPSAFLLEKVYFEKMKILKPYQTKLQLIRRHYGAIAYDWSHKIVKFVRVDGKLAYGGVLTIVSTITGAPLELIWTQGTSLQEVEGNFRELKKRFELTGQGDPELIFTDNLKDAPFLYKIFEQVAPPPQSLDPVVVSTTTKRLPLVPLKEKYLLIDTLDACVLFCTQIEKALQQREGEPLYVSLDTEWPVRFTKGSKREKISTIQLALRKDFVLKHKLTYDDAIIQLPNFKEFPQPLKHLLEDDGIIFCGVKIDEDAKKLQKDYDVEISNNNLRELNQMAKEKRILTRSVGLQKLVSDLAGFHLPKPKQVRVSPVWGEKRLPPNFIRYARGDSVGGVYVLEAILKVPDPTTAPLVINDFVKIWSSDKTRIFGRGQLIKVEDIKGEKVCSIILNEVFVSACQTMNGLMKKGETVQFCAEQLTTDLQPISLCDQSQPSLSAQDIGPTTQQLDKLLQNGDYSEEDIFGGVKKDIFHGIQKITRSMKKTHPAFSLFASQLSDAVYIICQEDVENIEKVLSRSRNSKQMKELKRKEYKTKFRSKARRYVPLPKVLLKRLWMVLSCFKDVTDPDNNEKLFRPKTWREIHKFLAKVEAGHFSDKTGINYYVFLGKDKYGVDNYRCIRGTSALEGFHHWLKKTLSAFNARPSLVLPIVLDFCTAWAIDSESKLGIYQNIGIYSPDLIESIHSILGGFDNFPVTKDFDFKQLSFDNESVNAEMFSERNLPNEIEEKNDDNENIFGNLGKKTKYLTAAEKKLFEKLWSSHLCEEGLDCGTMASAWQSHITSDNFIFSRTKAELQNHYRLTKRFGKVRRMFKANNMKSWYPDLQKSLRQQPLYGPDFQPGRSTDSFAFNLARDFPKLYAEELPSSSDSSDDDTVNLVLEESHDTKRVPRTTKKHCDTTDENCRDRSSQKRDRSSQKRDQRSEKHQTRRAPQICRHCKNEKFSDNFREYHTNFKREEKIKCRIINSAHLKHLIQSGQNNATVARSSTTSSTHTEM